MSITANPIQMSHLNEVMVHGQMKFEQAFSYDDGLEQLLVMDRNGAETLDENRCIVLKVGTGGGYAVAGTDLPVAQPPTFAAIAWEPVKDYQNVEIKFDDSLLSSKQSQLWPGFLNAADYAVGLAAKALHSFTNDMLIGDGSGRLAKIVTIDGTKKILTLDPVYCKSGSGSRARAALQYIHKSQPVSIASYDEADPSSAAVVDGGDGTSTDGDGFTVVNMTYSDTEHGCSILLDKAVSANVAPGMWVCVNKGLNAMVKGLNAIIGNGTIVSGLPRFGLVDYGTSVVAGVTIDRSTSNQFAGACYNLSRFVADPTAEITLNRQTVLNILRFGTEFSQNLDPDNKPTDYNAILVSPDVWSKYIMNATGSPVTNVFATSPVTRPDLGSEAPQLTNPRTGKPMTLIVVNAMPPDSMMFMQKQAIMSSMFYSDWDPTGSEYFTYFTRMVKYGFGDILRAVYHRLWMVACKHPYKVLSVGNIDIT